MLRVYFVLSMIFGLAANTALAQELSVTKIAGDVYRFKHDHHFSVFALTDAGVVVTDPINANAASWLKAKIAEMTDKPITHLVYSHSHEDHAAGGAAFGDVPNVIAHANAPEQIDGVSPTQRFDDTLVFKSGNQTFELTYLGAGHSDDLIAMVIRPENVGFIVDAAGVKQLPYRDMPHSNVDGLIEQVRKIETLDFDIFAGGHGELGVKSDATPVRLYLEELRSQVLSGLKAGKSVDELTESVTMNQYKGWGWTYENWRVLNIQGMARHLKTTGAVN
ncbi:MAG: MBL fold metallo-hydrolase [Arenicella sp.]